MTSIDTMVDSIISLFFLMGTSKVAYVMVGLSCLVILFFHRESFKKFLREDMFKGDADSAKKSFSWVILTFFGGIGIQILLILAIPLFRGEYFNHDFLTVLEDNKNIFIKDGGLLFFSVAVVVTILGDLFFSKIKPVFDPVFTVIFVGIVPILPILFSSIFLAICFGKNLSAFLCRSEINCNYECIPISYLEIIQLTLVLFVMIYAFFMKFYLFYAEFKSEQSCQQRNQHEDNT